MAPDLNSIPGSHISNTMSNMQPIVADGLTPSRRTSSQMPPPLHATIVCSVHHKWTTAVLGLDQVRGRLSQLLINTGY